ncbi:MAG TPA: alpha-amylase/4-alpha-glucanotransferase domain-containing protein [Nitrososphaerales archaeon]|nr:alpha-amylase/4-alpha-glucanotransferase domain-containing protein [Nitrososphaerales archaeon]
MSSERKIKFALVIHNHQPFGNRDEIIERIFQTSYFPFLKILETFPRIQVNLHYTGFLLDWMGQHHPEFLDLLRSLVDREQVELVGGAYFEPVVAVIPDVDIRGQTTLLHDRIKALFLRDPHGFWTAERAWEPHLPEILSDVGANHSFIDDVSFESVGLSERDCYEPYLVESRGKHVTIFPILKKLRYMIPFRSISSTILFLKNARGKEIAVYGDDGEKFGAWPNTFERVYKEGWLEAFFREINRNSWIETVRISEYLRENPPKRRIYLPASTYSEMMEWSIPFFPAPKLGGSKREGEKVPRRGFWRLFLAKYPESARMYSKMLELSEKLHALGEGSKNEAMLDLWKGQCNDAYWHGIFGGLYAPFLRTITFENLIRAQVGYDKLSHSSGENWASVYEKNSALGREFELETKDLVAAVSPRHGGAVCELDFKPRFANLLDTLTRRPERYHSQIKYMAGRTIVPTAKKKHPVSIHESSDSKEKGLQNLLVYDRYQKFAFVDYLVEPDSKIKSFERQNFREVAQLPARYYEAEIQKSNQYTSLIQNVKATGARGESIDLIKRISLSTDHPSLRVEYEIRTSGEKLGTNLFLPEINLASLSDASFLNNFGGKARIVNSENLEIDYEDLSVSIRSEEAHRIWIIPVRTVSLSEEGFESNLQEISILPNYPIHARSGEGFLQAAIDLEFRAH